MLKLCGLVGEGDIWADGSGAFRIWPAKEIGGAGLQDATVVAAVPRGKPLNSDQCRAMATVLKAAGKWKFTPRRAERPPAGKD